MSNTFTAYIFEIKSKYEVEKKDLYSDFLLKPSPAQLRELCLLLYDNGIAKKDKEVFELFFKPKPETTLRKAIENFDLEKFKKISNFLNEKSQTTSPNALNLIAILVNYEQRPYSYFLKCNINYDAKNKEVIEKTDEQNNEIITTDSRINFIKKKVKKKIAIGFFGLLGLGSIGYTAKNVFLKNKECMQWQNNHYELVDCTVQGITSANAIIATDENVIHLKQIDVNKKTIFFNNNKPLIWYHKFKGKVTFYNQFCFHPITGKPLKPITKYMINKYVLQKTP